MKRLLTLAFAAAFTFGAFAPAAAIDVTATGTWEVGMGWAENISFYDKKHSGEKRDPFIAAQRVRPQIDFIASESLRSVLAFEIGTTVWGRNDDDSPGGQLDADSRDAIKLRRAYLEWAPVDNLTLRMGIQGVALPSAAFGNPVLDTDIAGVVAGYKFNDMFTLNAFWLRPFDANMGESNGTNAKDEMDVFGMTLAITGDRFNVTPWAAYARTGNASGYWDYRSDYTGGFNLTDTTGDLKGYSNLWWVGAAVELKFLDPFIMKMDAMYGAARGDDAPEFSGWLVAGLFEYVSGEAWGKPGLIGWYASGDKSGAYNDGKYGKYGRMPIIGADNAGFVPASLGYPGSNGCMTDSLISASGVGSWGAGLQLADFTFVDKLSHTLRAVYIRGTNDEDMVKKGGAGRYGEPYNIQSDFFYMTKKDYAVELDFVSTLEVNENLNIYLETGFIYMNLDRGTWGKLADTSNAWKAEVVFVYSF